MSGRGWCSKQWAFCSQEYFLCLVHKYTYFFMYIFYSVTWLETKTLTPFVFGKMLFGSWHLFQALVGTRSPHYAGTTHSRQANTLPPSLCCPSFTPVSLHFCLSMTMGGCNYTGSLYEPLINKKNLYCLWHGPFSDCLHFIWCIGILLWLKCSTGRTLYPHKFTFFPFHIQMIFLKFGKDLVYDTTLRWCGA